MNIIDGEEFIFGRGTIDDKQAVLAILENLNRLQQDGDQPSRTFYVAFGHDEEVSGHQGAAHISTILKQKLIESKKNTFTFDLFFWRNISMTCKVNKFIFITYVSPRKILI